MSDRKVAKGDSAATPKNFYRRTSEKRRSVRITTVRGKAQRENPNNLSRFRWHHSLPDAEADAELVRRAKAGDTKAQRQLVANYHRVIVGSAGKRRVNYQARRGNKEYTNGAFDDLVGRGFEALWRAILSYKPALGVPFNVYAQRCISGQISEESKDFVKRGLVGETRMDRWLFSHPKATPEELVAAFKKKGRAIELCEAAQEIRSFKARYQRNRYSPPSDGEDDPWD
jgi:hypothetical protein